MPIALGVLISPMPIVAVVLMLVTPRAKSNSLAFLLGWIVGIFVVGSIVLLVAGASADDGAPAPAWTSWVKIALGVLVLLVAAKQWSGRPRSGAAPASPRWMDAVDHMKPPAAAGLALLLSAVNPKNLLIIVSGAAAIAAATTDRTEQFTALGIFTLVASVGVAAPIVIYVAMGARAAGLLDRIKVWMIANNAVILVVLLVVIGAKMIGDGVSAL
ncbi:GAP family protein [Cellulomonas sp. PhB150]|uniref:GAP family protein n=1 Tax=Cellulomonas sp. PhB150 TaxID=2485188 RepID=UPI001F3FEB17|nr:GAP family protein [Cellulomonas sp. PhB150]